MRHGSQLPDPRLVDLQQRSIEVGEMLTKASQRVGLGLNARDFHKQIVLPKGHLVGLLPQLRVQSHLLLQMMHGADQVVPGAAQHGERPVQITLNGRLPLPLCSRERLGQRRVRLNPHVVETIIDRDLRHRPTRRARHNAVSVRA
ncbi:MAG: hypothetical protein ACI9MC_001501 [Kiritimatiellia bacterium]